jgi:Domain of unknown function (DUF4375)
MISSNFEQINKIFNALAQREEKLGKESINDIEQVVLVVWHASGIIGNGGFRYFFECGLSLKETATAYEQIGVEKAVLVLRKVLSLFPSQSVPEDWDERMNIVEKLYTQNAELFDELESNYYASDDLMERQLAGWIKVHKDIFEK